MKVICLDDEKIILQGMIINCKKVEAITEVIGFNTFKQLTDYLKDNTADVIFSDINMPDVNGIDVAKYLRENHPEINVVFTTGYTEYTNQAIRASAKGYLLKPISKEMIEEQINYFLEDNEITKRVVVQSFGNFDIKVDGKPLALSSKAKEVLAYLVDRNGSAVNRKELAAVVYEDDAYSRTIQSYITKNFAELKKVLEEHNIGDLLLSDANTYAINTKLITCDSYEYLKGNKKYKNSYHGEYMIQYPWGDTELYRFE
ncbi:MAG: response regulator [Acholeplasmatales bacterium]|nr:response regulator [Acholeplasmatales bacterium]